MRILFLHVWQSTPGGVKPTFLAQHGHEVLNPTLPDDDFDAAVRIAQAEYGRGKPTLKCPHTSSCNRHGDEAGSLETAVH
jgi:hypothetical protein